MSRSDDLLERIAVALERIADQRDTLLAEAKEVEAKPPLTVGEIIDVVSAVTQVDILSKSRVLAFVWGRHAAMTAMRERLHMSLPAIGQALDVDHTTVVHGLTRFREKRDWSAWDTRRWGEITRLLDNCQESPTLTKSAFEILTNQSV